MTFRVGDIVRRIGDGFHCVVKRVNGNKLNVVRIQYNDCLLYTSPSPRDRG